MREHEMDNARPAPRNTPEFVLWLMFLVAVGAMGLLMAPQPDTTLASARMAGPEAGTTTTSEAGREATPVPATPGARTAMGD